MGVFSDCATVFVGEDDICLRVMKAGSEWNGVKCINACITDPVFFMSVFMQCFFCETLD